MLRENTCQSVNAYLEKEQGGNKTFPDKNWELLQAVDPTKGEHQEFIQLERKWF